MRYAGVWHEALSQEDLAELDELQDKRRQSHGRERLNK